MIYLLHGWRFALRAFGKVLKSILIQFIELVMFDVVEVRSFKAFQRTRGD
jgi:hypothetical protein